MKKLLAFALAGVAGGAPLLGCERLFGVDFGDTPSRDDAAAADDDATVPEGGGVDGSLPDASKDGSGDAGTRCTEPCTAEPWTTKAAVAIAIDDTNVYFAVPNTGLAATLQRCAKEDKCAKPAVVTSTPDPVKLVESAATLYWSTPTTVRSIAATANNGTAKVMYEDTNVGITAFAVGEGYLYPRRGDAIMRCPLSAASCSPATVVGGQGGAPSLVVTSGTSMVWGATIDSMVHRCDPAQCGPTKVTLGGPYENTSVIDAKGDVLVWPASAPTAGVYVCVGKGACTPRLLAASSKPISPVTDGEDVYWGDTDAGAILRCPVGGCPKAIPHVEGQTLRAKDQVVVDGAGVYWTTSGGIRRAPK